MDLSKLNTNEPIQVKTQVTENESQYASNEIVTLRIRTETGKRTLIVKLTINDKLAEIYKLVRPYLEDRENSQKIVIRTNFPNKTYLEDEIKNLKECGMAPSCALVIQVI